VASFVASGAVAPLDVVIKLALELGSYFLAVNDGVQVRSFESLGEFSGLLVFGSAGEMGSILGTGARGGGRFLVGLILCLIPFFFGALFFRRLDLWGIQEVGDGRLDATKIRWVGACVDQPF
jgi:hypothetical protein